MILLTIYIYSYTQYSFQKYVSSLWEVAFKTHSSPSERVWLSMVWFTVSCCTKGNPFIYTTIPLKEGDVSVIKRNAWNCHLKKYSVPCRKYSIILKGTVFFNKQLLFQRPQCSMPLCKFPWKGCNILYLFIPLKRGWYSLLRRKLHKQSHHLQKIGN